jgi:hypothetical protein
MFLDGFLLPAEIRIPLYVVGLFGNILSFLVFSRKSFSGNSISIYCRALIISEFFVLMPLALDIGLTFKSDLTVVSNFFCKFSYYIIISGSSTPGWILAVLSLDKMLCIRWINKFLLIKKRSFQLTVVLVIAISNLFLYLLLPFGMQIETISVESSNNVTSQVTCDLVYNEYSNEIAFIYLIESNLIPFVLMISSSFVTMRVLVKSRKNLGNRVSARRRVKDLNSP